VTVKQTGGGGCGIGGINEEYIALLEVRKARKIKRKACINPQDAGDVLWLRFLAV
jgi:hypothetical protein